MTELIFPPGTPLDYFVLVWNAAMFDKALDIFG